MNYKLTSGLVTSAVAAAFLAMATAPSLACMHNKAVTSGLSTGLDNPVGFSGDSPDFQALAKAVGGFGAITTLLAGGTMLYRRRQWARLTEANAAAVLAETDLTFTTQTETILVSDSLLTESEGLTQADVEVPVAR